ncbi:ATP-binding cassette domain-containing protein [Williamsoniiplasma lucivorax]|uniref:ABC transporter ATP-binding protein n=1 Tax=Williamsoniiplasma lucivorax TaxID=209274 RepID=A0A2S5REI1_9MOLU|nr:ABC transporter ATP-binding protein [Williamsoniiplasma lucivorax]PPE05721.1 ABC transporter ATP-binding protein [Williamsoniiplasma lucivorax]
MKKSNLNETNNNHYNFVSFQNFSKRFNALELIGPLNFGIAKNKVTLIVGRSGSGKSVILNSIMGTFKSYKGEIVINGIRRKSRQGYQVNDEMGYYTQMDFLSYDVKLITYLNEISQVLGLSQKFAQKQIEELLQMFELHTFKNKKIKDFSWGMKNRLNLIISLLKDPNLIIWDEPGANLDSVWQAKIKNTLINYKTQGRTILLVVHNIDNWIDIADELILVDKGQILYNSKIKNIDLYFKNKLLFISDIATHPAYQQFKTNLTKHGFVIFEENLANKSMVVGVLEKDKDNINLLVSWLVQFNLLLKEIVSLPMNHEAIYNSLLYSNQIKELSFYFKNMRLKNFGKLATVLKKYIKRKNKEIKKLRTNSKKVIEVANPASQIEQLEKNIEQTSKILGEIKNHTIDQEWFDFMMKFLKIYFLEKGFFNQQEQKMFEDLIKFKLSTPFLIGMEEVLLHLAINACLHSDKKENDKKEFIKIADLFATSSYKEWPKQYKVNKKINTTLTKEHEGISEKGSKLFW